MNLRARLVIDEMARHRVQFEHLCRSLTPSELATQIPGAPWTVKDYIAHLCTIDGLIAAGFSPIVGLTAPAPDVPMPQPFDIDEWNEAIVKKREDVSVETLLSEAATHRADFVAAVEKLTDEDLDRVIPYGGDRKSLNLKPSMVRFGGLLWGIAIHDPTHTRDILRALPRRGEEAWISEWLASVNESQVPAGVREQRV
jgi:hypothetical protein